LALFLVALLAATMPLRLALFWAQADRWLSAADVEGSIWGGVLKEGHVGHLSLGDARMALDVPALLSGRIGLRFFAAGDLQGSGIAMLGRDRRELRAQSLRFPIQALSASLPLDGDMMRRDRLWSSRCGWRAAASPWRPTWNCAAHSAVPVTT
jgi:hypothetical protein